MKGFNDVSITVWKLHTNTDTNDGEKVADLCLENSIVAMGWSLNENQIQDEE